MSVREKKWDGKERHRTYQELANMLCIVHTPSELVRLSAIVYPNL